MVSPTPMTAPPASLVRRGESGTLATTNLTTRTHDSPATGGSVKIPQEAITDPAFLSVLV